MCVSTDCCLQRDPGCHSLVLSSRAVRRDVGLLHVYAWRRGDDGPYFIGSLPTVDEGISIAETSLKDCRRGFVRAEVQDARELKTLWSSVLSVER
jgi:hypothetical protein